MNINDLIKNIILDDLQENGGDILAKKTGLAELYSKYQDCKNCGLCKTRKNIIFGKANPKANVLIVLESPLKEEDEQGRCFIGKKGELLDKMLASINLKKEDVYITDIVKCYPCFDDGDKRTPNKDEISSCFEIFEKQIEIINPKLIIAMGNTSSMAILNTDKDVLQTRGEIHQYKNIPVVVTFHPSYLMRVEDAKKLAWEDLKKIKEFLK